MKQTQLLVIILLACFVIGGWNITYAGQASSADFPAEIRKHVVELSSADPARRAAAACALGKMRERAAPAIPFLIDLLSDGAPISPEQSCGNQEPFEDESWQPTYEQVREPSPGEAATYALMAIGESALTPLKTTLLDGKTWRARKNAAWALAHRGEAVEQLVSALKDPAWQVRAQAAYALFQRGGASPRVVVALISALKDESWQVRAQAVLALGHKGDSRVDVVAPLLLALKDENAQVRESAAGALWHNADSRAFESLMEALKDEDKRVRQSAAQTLGNRAGDREVELLIAARNNSDGRVREGVKKALAVIKMRMQGQTTNLRRVKIPD
jgi:HEAT repeat protein